MPSASKSQTIWTPGGEVSIHRDSIPITRRQLQMLADLHEFAHYHDVVIFCKKCEHPISGANATMENASVRCSCREWRYIP